MNLLKCCKHMRHICVHVCCQKERMCSLRTEKKQGFNYCIVSYLNPNSCFSFQFLFKNQQKDPNHISLSVSWQNVRNNIFNTFSTIQFEILSPVQFYLIKILVNNKGYAHVYVCVGRENMDNLHNENNIIVFHINYQIN